MKLIDKDALMKWANDHYDFEEFAVGYFAKIIQDIPTVDAVPVIRCKDCKYYLADPWGYGNCNQMTFNYRRVRDADYCSWAERKEE